MARTKTVICSFPFRTVLFGQLFSYFSFCIRDYRRKRGNVKTSNTNIYLEISKSVLRVFRRTKILGTFVVHSHDDYRKRYRGESNRIYRLLDELTAWKTVFAIGACVRGPAFAN